MCFKLNKQWEDCNDRFTSGCSQWDEVEPELKSANAWAVSGDYARPVESSCTNATVIYCRPGSSALIYICIYICSQKLNQQYMAPRGVEILVDR